MALNIRVLLIIWQMPLVMIWLFWMVFLMTVLLMITKVTDLNLKSINSIMQVDSGMDLIFIGRNCMKHRTEEQTITLKSGVPKFSLANFWSRIFQDPYWKLSFGLIWILLMTRHVIWINVKMIHAMDAGANQHGMARKLASFANVSLKYLYWLGTI